MVILILIIETLCSINIIKPYVFLGTVPLRSLLSVGVKWGNGNNNGKSFGEIGFRERTHSGILKDQEYIQHIISYLS